MFVRLGFYVNDEDAAIYMDIKKEYKEKGLQGNILFNDMLKSFISKREKVKK